MPPATAPQHCPTPVELDDLELICGGSPRPLRAFNQPGSPLTLTLPPEVAAAATAAGAVELVDPEGVPLARVSWPEGDVQPLAHAEYGPFADLRLTRDDYRARHAGRTVVPVTDALTTDQLEDLAGVGPVTLLTLVGAGTPALSPPALVRATHAAARLLRDAVVVTVPLASHGDPEADRTLRETVLAGFAAGDPVRLVAERRNPGADPAYPPDIALVVDHDRPPPERQGLVVFLTGLSGSGKSTLARMLVDRLLEQGDRTVTSLDGDVVRRHLSAGLGFSRADRETNIRRIGWVAAEIARHGGVAVVSPIAPFAETRQQVRQMVEAAGGAFFLVHVATPLAECERRDRKGLYARARAGEIPDFTGISSPYEEPVDADVRIDTTGLSVEDAARPILAGLHDSGYVDLTNERPSDREPAGPEPLHVLFVCTANICRSPSMELMARAAVPDASRVEFSSAGTHADDGAPMDPVVAEALPVGADPSAFHSRHLTPDLLDRADLVLTAETAHRSFILDERPGVFRKVFTLGQFAEGVRRLGSGRSGAALLAELGENRGTADPALDVADPYRQGPEAAASCVARLHDLLDVVLPALAPEGVTVGISVGDRDG